jgi:hypothetical protein
VAMETELREAQTREAQSTEAVARERRARVARAARAFPMVESLAERDSERGAVEDKLRLVEQVIQRRESCES